MADYKSEFGQNVSRTAKTYGVELACNVCGVAVEDWGVSVSDLSRVVEDNDLGGEGSSLLGRVVLGVTADVSSSDIYCEWVQCQYRYLKEIFQWQKKVTTDP